MGKPHPCQTRYIGIHTSINIIKQVVPRLRAPRAPSCILGAVVRSSQHYKSQPAGGGGGGGGREPARPRPAARTGEPPGGGPRRHAAPRPARPAPQLGPGCPAAGEAPGGAGGGETRPDPRAARRHHGRGGQEAGSLRGRGQARPGETARTPALPREWSPPVCGVWDGSRGGHGERGPSHCTEHRWGAQSLPLHGEAPGCADTPMQNCPGVLGAPNARSGHGVHGTSNAWTGSEVPVHRVAVGCWDPPVHGCASGCTNSSSARSSPGVQGHPWYSERLWGAQSLPVHGQDFGSHELLQCTEQPWGAGIPQYREQPRGAQSLPVHVRASGCMEQPWVHGRVVGCTDTSSAWSSPGAWTGLWAARTDRCPQSTTGPEVQGGTVACMDGSCGAFSSFAFDCSSLAWREERKLFFSSGLRACPARASQAAAQRGAPRLCDNVLHFKLSPCTLL